jgi:hypothetical protein
MKDCMASFSNTQLLPTLYVCLCRLCPMSSGTEIWAAAFGQHVHPILILVDFFFWGCLKDKVYYSNPLAEEELKKNRKEIANIPAEQLENVYQNHFSRYEECLLVEGQHFQHFLWSVNCKYLIPNVIGRQAYWIIGKISMRLAAVHRSPWSAEPCTGQRR